MSLVTCTGHASPWTDRKRRKSLPHIMEGLKEMNFQCRILGCPGKSEVAVKEKLTPRRSLSTIPEMGLKRAESFKSAKEVLKQAQTNCKEKEKENKHNNNNNNNNYNHKTPEEKPKIFKRITRSFSVPNDDSLLHFAVVQEDAKTLKSILEGGNADVNFMRPPGVSPLHQACVTGNLKCVKLLLEHGADLHLVSWQKHSPLKLAVLNGHFEVAEYLLQNGAKTEDIKDGF